MKRGHYRGISFVRIVCNMMVLLLVSFCILTPRLFPESSDTGADQARILYELGVLPEYDGVYLAKTADPTETEMAILRLLGSGNADEARNYYRYLTIELAPGLTIPEDKESLTETETYGLVLRALGFNTEDEAALEQAKAVGFGSLREVRDSGMPLTNGTFAIILYEALYVRPPNPENFTTVRILAYLNSDFKKILLENGLYDDIPQTYAPLFNSGIYKQNSFATLPGTQGRNEWVATYLSADSEYISSYIEGLLSGDWSREGTYSVEGDIPATIELLYRPLPQDSTRELGLVVKYYEDGTVEWALFLN